MNGKLTAVVGVMGSGKTESLIAVYNDRLAKGLNPCVFKHMRDTRTDLRKVCSRSGACVPAIPIMTINEIYDYSGDLYDTILIDEIQFFDEPSVVDDLLHLASLGIEVYVFGLDLTSEGKPFGRIGEILAHSCSVLKLQRKCELCDDAAYVSHYTGNDKSGDVKIGDLGEYVPLCYNCYQKEKDKPSAKPLSEEEETFYQFSIGSEDAGFRLELSVTKEELDKAGYTYEDVMDIRTIEGALNFIEDLGIDLHEYGGEYHE
jgi:thymidine kinase